MKGNRLLLKTILLIAALGIAAASFTAAAGATDDVTPPVVTSVVPADGSTIYTNGDSTIYYQLGNPTPMTIRAEYSDEPGGSGVDTDSVMVHLDIANMLYDCPVWTDAEIACNATAADLAPGLHPLDIYVFDLAGNPTVHRTWFTVAVDDETPSYANLSPADGSIIYTSELNSAGNNDMDALRVEYDVIDPEPSSGVNPMSHVNDSFPPGVSGAMISNTSCVKNPDADNPVHYSCQLNRARLLQLGENQLSVLLKDRVGNNNHEDPSSLNTYTVIDDVEPVVSDIAADETAISASFSDPLPDGALSTLLASGIDTDTAKILVDDAMITEGCTATETGISCPTPTELPDGTYDIEVMVSDNDGNQGLGAGTLSIGAPSCTPGSPAWACVTGTPTGPHWPITRRGCFRCRSGSSTSVLPPPPVYSSLRARPAPVSSW
ncbi:MAG: hypothetical protein IBX61_00960 [Thermoleophilia bacterium]|nr:hypothetical protein [Thermoleophilia bacterium]